MKVGHWLLILSGVLVAFGFWLGFGHQMYGASAFFGAFGCGAALLAKCAFMHPPR